MQQDPVHTQTHSRTHRDSEGTEDSHATGSTPLTPCPHHHPTHTFYADSGKKEKFAAHIWSLCADSWRPSWNKVTAGVTERGQGPRGAGSTGGADRWVCGRRKRGGARAETGQRWLLCEERERLWIPLFVIVPYKVGQVKKGPITSLYPSFKHKPKEPNF